MSGKQHTGAPAPATPSDAAATWGTRHTQVFMVFLCFVVAYVMVSSLSVAIVAMADQPGMHWCESSRGLVLSAFLWGFCVSPIAGARLTQSWGPKLVLFWMVLLSSTMELLTPIAATLGSYQSVIALRVAQGLLQGPLAPASHALLARWAPAAERSRLGAFAYGGAQFGTMLGLLLGGVLSGSSWGWSSVFYLSGCTGLTWCLAWYLLGADSPPDHPYISCEERTYIEENVRVVTVSASAPAGKAGAGRASRAVPTPWGAILRSRAVWGLTAAHCGQMTGYWTLLTQLPSYMKHVQKFDINRNGALSALPYFTMWLVALPLSWASDALIRSKKVSVTFSRKLFNTIAQWGGAAVLAALGLGAAGDVAWRAVFLLTLAMTVNAAMYVGFQINHLDISPSHAAALMGFTNLWANLLAVTGPALVPVIVYDQESASLWHIVFLIAAGVFFSANLVFLLWGSAEVQPWNSSSPSPPAHQGHQGTLSDGELGLGLSNGNGISIVSAACARSQATLSPDLITGSERKTEELKKY